ncbi:MAG: hypothetical protein Q8N98_01380, partial [bacterium]|nr:hypothetical protein [bacterium]
RQPLAFPLRKVGWIEPAYPIVVRPPRAADQRGHRIYTWVVDIKRIAHGQIWLGEPLIWARQDFKATSVSNP